MYKLLLDLDGVFSDIEHTFYQLTGLTKQQRIEQDPGNKQLWQIVAKHPLSWANHKVLPGAVRLWNYVKNYNPTILSGTPAGRLGEVAAAGKRMWIDKYLSPNVKLITVLVPLKYRHATKNSILVDDREKTIDKWNQVGGIGILHTSANDTIGQLQKLFNQ